MQNRESPDLRSPEVGRYGKYIKLIGANEKALNYFNSML